MPIIINVKGYGQVQFPDGTSKEEMEFALSQLPSKDAAASDDEFLPPLPPTSQSEASKRAEKIEYGLAGAGLGALGAGAVAIGQGALGSARALGRASEEGRLAAQAAMQTAAQAPESAGVVRHIPESSGFANWARKMARDLPYNIAESAESMRKTDPRGAQALIDEDIRRMQKIREMGEGKMRLMGQGPTQLMVNPEIIEERAAKIAQPLAKGATGLDAVASIFQRMLQNPIFRYLAPPLALGSAGMDIADIVQRQREVDPNRVEQALSGLSAAGALTSLAAPAVGLPMMAIPPVVRGYREHERLMQTDPEYAEKYQRAFSGLGQARRFPRPTDVLPNQ